MSQQDRIGLGKAKRTTKMRAIMGRIPRMSISKSVWTTKLSSRFHALYIISMGHSNMSGRSFDYAERHVALYKARMPWKRSEFNKQIVPGYIHPVPKGLRPIRIDEHETHETHKTHKALVNLDVMFEGNHAANVPMKMYDRLYDSRRQTKIMTVQWLTHIAKEVGYGVINGD